MDFTTTNTSITATPVQNSRRIKYIEDEEPVKIQRKINDKQF